MPQTFDIEKIAGHNIMIVLGFGSRKYTVSDLKFVVVLPFSSKKY